MDKRLSPEDELRQARKNRYHEARDAGLTHVEATLFAESDEDIGTLRKCVKNGWTVEQIKELVL